MPMQPDSPQISAKEEVVNLLRRLPGNVTLEDIRYHIYVLEQVKSGLESADAGPYRKQEEMRAEVKRWLTR